MNEESVTALRDLGVSPDLLALLPDEVPFVLKDSQGAKGNLPLIAASQHSPAALHVGKTSMMAALDPEDARRYRDLTGVKVPEPDGNQSTWRLIIHPADAQAAGAASILREAIAASIAPH